jgi:D-aspartate ligase
MNDRSATAVLCGDLNMLRCFVDSGVPALVVASDAREVTLRSRYCRRAAVISPLDQPERAVADLVRLGQDFTERPVLFYGTDAQLLLISRNREKLARYFRFRMPRAELIEQLVDKRLFAGLADELGLPVPKTCSSQTVHSADDVLEKVGLPCLFKPSVHIGWFAGRARHQLSPHKALRVETRAELTSALSELALYCDSFVVQSYVPGGEENIYSYHAYLDEQSRPLAEFVGRKLRTYPQQAGVSTYLELIRHPEFMALGRQVAMRLGLTGPVKLDFKRGSQAGQFYLLEANARFTLWNHLGAACGVNLPLAAYADLTGRPRPQPCAYRVDVRWLSFGNDLRTFWRDYRTSGSLSTQDWLWSYRTRKVYDIWHWRDPLPFIANALRFSDAFARRMAQKSLKWLS